MSVAVSVTQLHTPVIGATQDSLPTITCVVDLRAVASGHGTAAWMSAKVRWYAGTDRSSPIDSGEVSASEIQSAWGKPSIAAGQTQESSWTFTAGVPFTASFEYRYQPQSGDAKAASVDFTCGPSTSASTPAPSITDLTVRTGSGDLAPGDTLEPGDTLTIGYSAAGTAGIWQTAVTFSGPCDVQRLFPERLQTSVTHSIRVAIPAECRLGAPLTVTAFARDAGLRTGSRALATGVALVDVTPPRISPWFALPNGPSLSPQLTGEFFGGDSIEVLFQASDNHGVGALSWEVLPSALGVDDSLTVNGADVGPRVFVHLRPDASGPFQLRLHARDVVGLSSDTVITAAGAAIVHPTIERPTAWANVDGQTLDALVDTRRSLAYLIQANRTSIPVLSLSTLTVTQTIQMPSIPTELDITAGGDSLVVVLPVSRALGIVDLRQTPLQVTLLPLTLLDSTIDQRPAHVRTLSNGKAFVSLSGSAPSAGTLIEVNLATAEQRVRTDAGDGGNVAGGCLGRSLDHSVIVVNGGPGYFQRYDVSTDSFGSRESANVYGVAPVLDATGRYVAIGLDIYDQSLQHLRRVSSPVIYPGFVFTALSPDGEVLYQVLSGTGLVRSRVSDGAMLDRSPNPIEGWYPRIADDGTLLMTLEALYTDQRKISTIDLR